MHLQAPRLICKYHKILSVCFFQYYLTFNVSTAGLSQSIGRACDCRAGVSEFHCPRAAPIIRVLK